MNCTNCGHNVAYHTYPAGADTDRRCTHSDCPCIVHMNTITEPIVPLTAPLEEFQAMVEKLHIVLGHPAPREPRALPLERAELRIALIREEFEDELIPAIMAGDAVETYDAALDILYVTFGLLVEMGMDARPGFEEVQRANMSKLGEDGKPIISRGIELDGFPAGKGLKGPNYSPPDLARILKEMGYNNGQ